MKQMNELILTNKDSYISSKEYNNDINIMFDITRCIYGRGKKC